MWFRGSIIDRIPAPCLVLFRGVRIMPIPPSPSLVIRPIYTPNNSCHLLLSANCILLDEMLGPEVGAEVHDLPAPEADEQYGGADAEVLDSAVCALVGVAQLDLARAQVVHLIDNLGQHLLDAAQLCLNGLELLGRLNSGPVLGVGANVDIQLDVTGGGSTGCRVEEVELAWMLSCLSSIEHQRIAK